MRSRAGAALVAVALLASAPASAQSFGAEPELPEPEEGREPIAPLEIVRSPVHSANVDPGCSLGLLSVTARAKLPDRSEGAAQLGFFGRCRLNARLSVRATMPFVLNRWHSHFESTDHTEWGSPSIELRLQLVRIRGVRVASYLGGAVNWQQRPSVLGQLEYTGMASPGLAASTLFRGLSFHANAEIDLPFGARNARRTFLIGAAAAFRPRRGVSLHLGYQNAIDLLVDSYWADARVFIFGGRVQVSRGWTIELGTRVAVNPEAELTFNSLGRVATLMNFIYHPTAEPKPAIEVVPFTAATLSAVPGR